MENHVYHTLSLHENRVSVSSSSKSWHKIFEQSSYSAMLHIWESVPPPESIPVDSWNCWIGSRRNSGIGWNQFRRRNQFHQFREFRNWVAIEFCPIPESQYLMWLPIYYSLSFDSTPVWNSGNWVKTELVGVGRNSWEFLAIPTNFGIESSLDG